MGIVNPHEQVASIESHASGDLVGCRHIHRLAGEDTVAGASLPLPIGPKGLQCLLGVTVWLCRARKKRGR